jgi:hypothetical protein
MTSYRVKLRGTPKIIQIEAEMFEETPDPADPMGPSKRVAKDANGKEIAWFDGKEIAGWWIEPENTLHVTINNSSGSEEVKVESARPQFAKGRE